jgi:hypothetical protein
MLMRKCTIALGIAAAVSIIPITDAGASPSSKAMASPILHAPAIAPRTMPREAANGMVLYRQAGAYTGSVIAQTSTNGNNTAAADDFSVSDVSGWTISAFNFAVIFPNYSAAAGITYNVTVYADNAGVPNTSTAPCSASGVAGILDNDNTMLTIPLPQACQLPQGTYWVALQANINQDSSQPFTPTLDWNGFASQTPLGGVAVWENPNNGYGTGCTTWSPATGCSFGVNALGFDVIGFPGGGNGSALTLALTLALDNGDPTQCGSASSLSVSAGDKVNLCYSMTNHTGVALDYQTLADTLGGTLYSLRQQPLADGATYRFNRVVTAETATSGIVQATLSAQDRLPGYDFVDSGSSNFVDISSNGTRLDLGNDNTTEVDMPFSFNFYGATTNVLGVATNGGMFVGTIRPLQYSNLALPTDALGAPAILPLWDDFETATSGGIYYATLGSAPNRRFIVEWSDLVHYNSASNTDSATFEVVIDEASGNFSFEYADVNYTAIDGSPDPQTCDGGVCATIGVQKDPSFSTQYSFDTASISNGKSIAWAPGIIDNTFTTAAAATLDVGAPVVSVAPGALTATAAIGSTATVPLTIGNTGNRDLSWSIDDAAADRANAQAHFPSMPYHAPAMSERKRQALATIDTAASGSPAKVDAASDLLTNSPMAPATANVPAFAFGGVGPDGNGTHPDHLEYFPLDAADPSVLGSLSAFPIDSYSGGAFAHNDFSKQYVIAAFGSFLSMDTSTGLQSYIGYASAPGIRLTDLAWDATTQLMYVTGWDPVNTNVSYLYTIDLASAALTQVARVNGVFLTSATFDMTGHLYGLDVLGSQLVAIDKRNGEWQGIGPIGFDISYVGGIDFDPRTGVIWYAGHPFDPNPAIVPIPAIYTINPATGHASEMAPTAHYIDLTAFSLALPYAGCAAPGDIPWLSVTPASGITAGGDRIIVQASFNATGLAAGRYEANLCVRSNDLANRIVGVPVQFTVATTDTIFQDGFESQ